MSNSRLPERASLEYLKKLAKERLRERRATQPDAKLSTIQLELAREYGFASWRALKAEVDRRGASPSERFFLACRTGDPVTMRALLDENPERVRERDDMGQTALHVAVGHPGVVRLLLDRGADPNARDEGDNATPLHFAVAEGPLETVRLLLEAGADVHGHGDLHEGDVIGWGTAYPPVRPEIVNLLVERGARHHIFSAIASGDPDLVRRVVAENPDALKRRRSRFEQRQSALHFALGSPIGISPKEPQYDLARLLIELGADLEAEDDHGRTPLTVAMLHGDIEAMRLLKAAGAKEQRTREPMPSAEIEEPTYKQATPMLCVQDVDATVAWYRSLGFTLVNRYPDAGPMAWAALDFGKTQLMVQHVVARPRSQVALWLHTGHIDELYRRYKDRQLEAARAALSGEAGATEGIRFKEDLYEPFHGGRQFTIEDPDGFELVFQSD